MTEHHEVSQATNIELIAQRACDVFTLESVYDWQLEVADTLSQQKDCILSAPTGGGKTLTFYLPLLAFWCPGDINPTHQKIILIVSPLIELMREQVAQLVLRRIPAVAICQETLSKGKVLEVRQLRYTYKILSDTTLGIWKWRLQNQFYIT
jgi:superfamily II DNA helicase RecQ